MSTAVENLVQTDITKLVQPPTQAEIMRLLRERMPGLSLYNPSDQWLRPQVHGIEHHLPPDLNGAVVAHPKTGEPTKCDGSYLVRGRFLTQKDSSGKLIEGQDAQAIVAFLIHRERFGEMGVVWLPGRNKAEDEALKGLGRDKWLEYQALKDDEIIARRLEFKKNWESNPSRSGTPVPAPTPVENAATERRQEREHKQAYKFNCSVEECPGYGSNDWVKYVSHMQAAHSIMARRSVKEGIVTLTNAAGDTTIIGAMQATDGKPVEGPSDESLEAAAEAPQGSLDDVHPALKSVSTAKPAPKRRKKKGG